MLRRLYAEVQTGGDAAFVVFMFEKLPELIEIAVGAGASAGLASDDQCATGAAISRRAAG